MFVNMEEAHIYIYGIIDGFQDEDASSYGLVNLKDVKRQMDAQKDAKEIIVHIHSPGGLVSEGFAIHDFLRSQGKPITTLIEGECYSIATVIALAGDTRKMTSNSDFMIHNPWGGAFGDGDEIGKYAEDLKKCEDKIADFYAKKTNLNKDALLEMMKQETFMSAEDALKNGFITEIAVVMKAVARFNENSNKSKTKNEMSKENLTKKEAEGLFAKFEEKMKSLFSSNTRPQAKLVQDANGVEIDFYELEEDATPSVGDKANVDGQPADGEYVMPSGETYVFTDGELTEIREASDDEVEELKEEIEELKEELAQAKAQNEKNLKEFQKEFKAFKKSIGSSFSHEPEKDNFEQKKNQKVRTI